MVALSPDPLGRRFGQGRIGLEGFVEDFHFPPFLVDRLNRRLVAAEVATSQIQNPGAAVLVRKDLAAQRHGEIQPLEPSLYGFLFWPGQLVDSDETALSLVFQGRRHCPVAFQGDDKVLAKVFAHEGQVLLCGKPTVRQDIAVFQLVLAARLEHPPPHFVLGLLALPLDLPCRQIAVKIGLTHQFKRHRQRHATHMVKAIEDIGRFSHSG